MKKFIYIFVAVLACAMSNSCGNDSALKISAEREKFIADSLAKEQAKKDSLNLLIIQRCKPLFSESKDEFSDKTFVEPKNAPKYRNRNGVYFYFSV